jgi:hypothetical protein
VRTAKLLRSIGKPVPPKYTKVLTFETFRVLTFKERIKVILGWNFHVKVLVQCEHSPGERSNFIVRHTLTHQTSAEGVLREQNQ